MSNAVLTENEERLFGAAKEAEAEATQETKKQDVEELKKKYTGNGQKIYTITNTVAVDDDTEEEFIFLFRKPKPASYDRYVKTISNSASKASKTFAFDNIIDEQRDELKDTLEEYPAMAISLADKLLLVRHAVVPGKVAGIAVERRCHDDHVPAHSRGEHIVEHRAGGDVVVNAVSGVELLLPEQIPFAAAHA